MSGHKELLRDWNGGDIVRGLKWREVGCQIEEEVVELFTQEVSGRELIPKHLLSPVRAVAM